MEWNTQTKTLNDKITTLGFWLELIWRSFYHGCTTPSLELWHSLLFERSSLCSVTSCSWTYFRQCCIDVLNRPLSIRISLLCLLNPIPRGGGAYMPPYHISAIFSVRTYPRRLQLYSKFKFCNYRTREIGFGSKKISYVALEAAKVGRVAHFLLRFCLEILHSPKADEVFLLKSKFKDSKS